tara:strand:+ start:5534 stop:5761 length:228 start_codon:yes stop_codon:yes gene_type:complete
MGKPVLGFWSLSNAMKDACDPNFWFVGVFGKDVISAIMAFDTLSGNKDIFFRILNNGVWQKFKNAQVSSWGRKVP